MSSSGDRDLNEVPVCPRHPDTEAYVRCQRCGRPACYRCQRPAAVGVQCPDCVKEQAKDVRQATTRYGAKVASGRPTPVITYAIIAICVALYLAQLSNSRVTTSLWFVPALGAEEPWRFLTAAFLHSPSFYGHIAFNMFAVWLTGQYLEPLLGRLRFIVLYLLSAVGGSVALLAIAPRIDMSGWVTPAVGASGAVFGLFAATFALNRHLGRDSAGILVILAVNGVLGFVIPNIAWEAHLGGLLTGAAVAGVIALAHPASAEERKRRAPWQWAGFALIAVILAAVAIWSLQPVWGITWV